MVGLPFTCAPTARHSRFDPQLFQVFLLRRLWLLQLTATAGVGCHSTLVATTEQLARQRGSWDDGVSLWKVRLHASAGMPAPGSLRTSGSMDLARPDALDNRRLEIVADDLPLFLGAQLAVDTTVASVLRRDGAQRPKCANEDGAALVAGAKKQPTPELTSREADKAGCLGLRGWETVARGSSRLRPHFGQRQNQRRATAFEGPSSSSLAVEVGDLAGVQCCEGLRTCLSNAEVLGADGALFGSDH